TFALGGPQRRFAMLANRLGRKYAHVVVALDGCVDARRELDPGLELEIAPAPDVKGDTLGNLRRIRRMLSAQRPDLLCTYNWGAIEWAMANRFLPLAPHLHVEDGFGPEEAAGQIPRRVLTRRLALGRAQILVPSLTL